MALTKVRGFNRGKSSLDTQAICGPTQMFVGPSAIPAKGARWDPVGGGTLQRVAVNASTTVYPGHNTSQSQGCHIEDFGSLMDYHTAGGFCMTMYARYMPTQMGLFYAPSNGGPLMSVRTTRSYNRTSDFADYTEDTLLPGTGNASNVNYMNVANNQVLMAAGNYAVMWDDADAPTTYTSIDTSTVTPRLSTNWVTWHDGYYYFAGTNATTGGVIYRNTTFSMTGAVAVMNLALAAQSKLEWMPVSGAFITIGSNGGSASSDYSANGRAQIYRSTDGVTWAQVYLAATSATTSALADFLEMPSGLIIAVGGSGTLLTSSDGGLTWTQRTTGTTENITSITRTPDNLIVGITGLGNTVVSADGLTWTYTPTDTPAINLEAASVFFPFMWNGKLYASRTRANSRYINLVYRSGGKFDVISAYVSSGGTNTATGVPAGVFMADPYSGTGTLTGGQNLFGMTMAVTTNPGLCVYSGASQWSFKSRVTTAIDYDWHKLQIVGTAAPLSAGIPRFTFTVYLDDVLVYSDGTPLGARTADQRLWVTTAATGLNAFSDIAVNDFSGTRFSSRPDGQIQIRPRAVATTDVGTPQWTKDPTSAVSNAVAATGDGSVITAPSSVQSLAPNQTDTYSGGVFNVPSGMRIAAIQAAATFNRLDTSTPTVTFGVIDGATPMPVGEATLSGTSATNVTLTRFHTTNAAGTGWQEAQLNASQVQIKRTT